MNNYEDTIKKDGRDIKVYTPVIELFEKSNTPLSIKDVSRMLEITYLAAKFRLHNLSRIGILKCMKRGYYCLTIDITKYDNVLDHSGKLFFINGCIRYKGNPRGICVNIYNSRFGEIADGKYCRIEYYGKNNFVLRKTNKFNGSKIYLMKSKSTGISIARKFIPKEILSVLSNKSTQVKIGIYNEDWNISIKELFGTESKEEGELANELSDIGEIEKKNKFDDFKADILFIKNKIKIPIEITITNPLVYNKNKRSSVRSSLICSRFYFFIKWNIEYNTPTILVINNSWKKYGWIQIEEEYMKKFDCHIVYTDFKENWAKKVSQEINLLV